MEMIAIELWLFPSLLLQEQYNVANTCHSYEPYSRREEHHILENMIAVHL